MNPTLSTSALHFVGTFVLHLSFYATHKNRGSQTFVAVTPKIITQTTRDPRFSITRGAYSDIKL